MNPPATFRWSEHVCRICGARLGVDESGPLDVYECGNCGVSSKGAPEGVCGCGVHLGPKPNKKRDRLEPKGPRFECLPNPARGPDSPALFVIMFGGKPL